MDRGTLMLVTSPGHWGHYGFLDRASGDVVGETKKKKKTGYFFMVARGISRRAGRPMRMGEVMLGRSGLTVNEPKTPPS